MPELAPERPLDPVGSIKVKIGLLVALSILTAALVLQVGTRSGVPLWLTLPVTVAAALGLAACSSPAPDVSAPPPGDGPLVAFYGDSYTLGTGASDPSLRWSTIVSEQRGWREFNPSANGLGFGSRRTTR